MGRNNKRTYIIFVLFVLISVTIGYAVLNSTLNINGRSNISKNTWDIYFENIQVQDGSVEAVKIPTIENLTKVDFEVALNMPGDFYEFTIDVVNDGTIDAMIESILKEPELTENQKKYLNYIIEYENGEQISTKQLLAKESSVKLKIRVEIKRDIDASDLPEVGDVLYLSFTVNYVQADSNAVTVNSNKIEIKVVSGNLDTVGSEICIGDECFYLIKNNGSSVTMLSKYNLHVGVSIDDTYVATPLSNPTGIQDVTALGSEWISKYSPKNLPWIGISRFSDDNYWWNNDDFIHKPEYVVDYQLNGVSIPFVYDSNAYIYDYINNYKMYLEQLGVDVFEARVIKLSELDTLGCDLTNNTCTSAPTWIYSTSYWAGNSQDSYNIWYVLTSGLVDFRNCSIEIQQGVRPVVTIPINLF